MNNNENQLTVTMQYDASDHCNCITYPPATRCTTLFGLVFDSIMTNRLDKHSH